MTETKIPLVDSHLNTVIEQHEAVGILHKDSFPLASPTALLCHHSCRMECLPRSCAGLSSAFTVIQHALHLVSKHAWMYHAASQFANNMPCKARKQLPSNTHRFGHGGLHDAEQPEGRW